MDDDEQQQEEHTLRNDKGERVDELDLMGAAIFLSIQKGFQKLKSFFVPKKVE
jgi:hypothetical protein